MLLLMMSNAVRGNEIIPVCLTEKVILFFVPIFRVLFRKEEWSVVSVLRRTPVARARDKRLQDIIPNHMDSLS